MNKLRNERLFRMRQHYVLDDVVKNTQYSITQPYYILLI